MLTVGARPSGGPCPPSRSQPGARRRREPLKRPELAPCHRGLKALWPCKSRGGATPAKPHSKPRPRANDNRYTARLRARRRSSLSTAELRDAGFGEEQQLPAGNPGSPGVRAPQSPRSPRSRVSRWTRSSSPPALLTHFSLRVMAAGAAGSHSECRSPMLPALASTRPLWPQTSRARDCSFPMRAGGLVGRP